MHPFRIFILFLIFVLTLSYAVDYMTADYMLHLKIAWLQAGSSTGAEDVIAAMKVRSASFVKLVGAALIFVFVAVYRPRKKAASSDNHKTPHQ